MRSASCAFVPVGRLRTSRRGTRISRRIRSAISNAPLMMVRCSAEKSCWAATMSRISSVVTSSRCAFGSPPASRTTRSVALPRSQTAGREIIDRMSSGRATSIAQPSVRCMAIRFGASSPNTRVTKVSTMVTSTIAVGWAAAPRKPSGSTSGWDSDTAAAADARKPASVMPIWMVARNRFGSRVSLASTRPRRDCRSSRCTWLSRNCTSAISLPEKAALTSTRTSTRTIWPPNPPMYAALADNRHEGPTLATGGPHRRTAGG
jgi:hypothetical protein